MKKKLLLVFSAFFFSQKTFSYQNIEELLGKYKKFHGNIFSLSQGEDRSSKKFLIFQLRKKIEANIKTKTNFFNQLLFLKDSRNNPVVLNKIQVQELIKRLFSLYESLMDYFYALKFKEEILEEEGKFGRKNLEAFVLANTHFLLEQSCKVISQENYYSASQKYQNNLVLITKKLFGLIFTSKSPFIKKLEDEKYNSLNNFLLNLTDEKSLFEEPKVQEFYTYLEKVIEVGKTVISKILEKNKKYKKDDILKILEKISEITKNKIENIALLKIFSKKSCEISNDVFSFSIIPFLSFEKAELLEVGFTALSFKLEKID